MSQGFEDIFNEDVDHNLVMDMIASDPCNFLLYIESVVTSDSVSSRDKCMAIIMSRYVFNPDMISPGSLNEEIIMTYQSNLLILMQSSDEGIVQHAAVSMAVLAEFLLQADESCSILDDLIQSDSWLSLSVLTREIEIGENCTLFIPPIIEALESKAPFCNYALSVASNIVGELPKDFECDEFWDLLIENLENPDLCDLCLEVFIYARKCHLLALGDSYTDVIRASITHAESGICTSLTSVRFLLNVSYNLQKVDLELPEELFVGAIDLAMDLVSEEDVETTEESAESFGKALLQSLMWMNSEMFEKTVVPRIQEDSLCGNVILTLVYLLVDGDIMRDEELLEQVIHGALDDSPRIIVVGLELIQLLVQKEFTELNYQEMLPICNSLLTVDFACHAASVAVYAICQNIDIDLDGFCWELFTCAWSMPSSMMAPVIIDLVSLFVPDLQDSLGLLENILPVVEEHIGAHSDAEIMQSICHLFVELSKQVEIPDELLDVMFQMLMYLQDSETCAGYVVQSMGKLAFSTGQRFLPFLEPCVEAITRVSEDDTESASLAWRLLTMAGLPMEQYELP